MAPQGKVTECSINLTKNLIGAGLFSLPVAFYRGSVVLSIVILAGTGILCGSSFVFIAFLCKNLNQRTYKDCWTAAFGKASGWVVDSSIFVNGFFACMSYTILITDFMQKALAGLFGWEDVSRQQLIGTVSVACLLPLSLIKDLSPLKYTSMVGLLIIAAVFLYIVMDFFASHTTAVGTLKTHAFRVDMGIFSALAISTGAFKAHYNAPPFFLQLESDLAAHTQVVVNSFGCAFLIYASFGLAGCGLFGEEVLGNVLKNYPSQGNVPILLAWLGMAFAVIFTYPLVFSSARSALMQTLPALSGQNTSITVALVTLISLCACMVDDVSVVTGLLGATIGSALCWIFPAMIYVKASGGKSGGLQAPLLGKGPQIKKDGTLTSYAMALIVLGVISGTISTLLTLGVL